MYAMLWRSLPGPTVVRVLLALLLFFAVVAGLFLWVFPWLSPRLPFNDVSIGTGWGQQASSSIMGT